MQLLHASKQKEKKSKQISRMCPQILSLMKKKKMYWRISPSMIFEVLRRHPSRKLSNFNFHCIKTLYQNNLKNIPFFFTFFKG